MTYNFGFNPKDPLTAQTISEIEQFLAANNPEGFGCACACEHRATCGPCRAREHQDHLRRRIVASQGGRQP